MLAFKIKSEREENEFYIKHELKFHFYFYFNFSFFLSFRKVK